jgi:transposase-like protein
MGWPVADPAETKLRWKWSQKESMTTKRKFSRESKLEAVKLVRGAGYRYSKRPGSGYA